jgi:MerR family transcriptional regulator, mercuric resistance operon regulatory protein
MRPLTIGTLAKAAGVRPDAEAFPDRTASNYRNFGPEHVERLRFIRRAREIGFSIGEISCTQVQTLTTVHLGEVRAKIADLRRLETILAGALERCFAGPAPACPVLDMLASPRPS